MKTVPIIRDRKWYIASKIAYPPSGTNTQADYFQSKGGAHALKMTALERHRRLLSIDASLGVCTFEIRSRVCVQYSHACYTMVSCTTLSPSLFLCLSFFSLFSLFTTLQGCVGCACRIQYDGMAHRIVHSPYQYCITVHQYCLYVTVS